jgi:hypothetical protein
MLDLTPSIHHSPVYQEHATMLDLTPSIHHDPINPSILVPCGAYVLTAP